MHRLTTALSLLTILLLTTAASAQPTFQWGQRWGGAFNNNNSREEIHDMEVDHEGNIYIACSVTPGFMIGDSMHQNHGNSDLMLISFDCEGNVRWYEVFGKSGDDVFTFFNLDIEIDSNSLYYTGSIQAQASPFYFADSAFTHIPHRAFMSKFNLEGELKEFRWIWPGGNLESWPMGMYKRNDTIWMAFVSYAGQIQGHTVPLGYHLGVFDTSFNLHSVFTYGDPSPDQRLTGLQVDHAGNIYLGGHANNGTCEIGGTQIDGGLFIGKFSPQGQPLWVKGQEDPSGWNSALFDMVLRDGHIYFSGFVVPGTALIPATVIFGDTLTATNAGGSEPYFGRLDVQGNLDYHITVESANNVAISYAIVVIDDTVYTCGTTGGYNNFSFTNVQSTSGERHQYVLNYDETTGTGGHISLISPQGSNATFITHMANDDNGNLYIAGNLSSKLYYGPDSLFKDGGGTHDLFLVKYGVPACVDTTHTGIQLISDIRASVKIAPHPVHETARIEVTLPAGSTSQGLQWEMFDLQGKQVPSTDLHWQIQDGRASGTLSRGGLPPGLYMWRITDGVGPVASGKILFE